MKRTKTSKRAKSEGELLGWEYVGNYKYAGDDDIDNTWQSAQNLTEATRNTMAKKCHEAEYGKEEAEWWKTKLIKELKEDPSPPAPQYMVEGREPTLDEKGEPKPSLAARARALGFKDDMDDKKFWELLVQLDEFHELWDIEFHEYDNRVYEFCCNQYDETTKRHGAYKKPGKERKASDWYKYAMENMLL